LILTIDFLLARVQHFPLGEEYEVVPGDCLPPVAPERLPQQPSGAVAPHCRAQLASHCQAHPVESAIVLGRDQPEELPVHADAPAKDSLELGPAVEAILGSEPLPEPAHRRRP
jgi:hypothetical protein